MLVAVDVADRGDQVVRAALPWADAWDATLDLVYASEWSPALLPPPKDPSMPQIALRARWEAHAQGERQALEQLAHHVPDHRRGAVRFLAGRRTQILPELSDDYDVTVVGTHARRGLARVLLGSVSARLLREARGPVMVVGLGEEPAPLHDPPRLLVPVDERGSRVLPFVQQRFPQAHVQLAHVVPPGAWSPLLWAGEHHMPRTVDERIDGLVALLEEQGREAGLVDFEAVVLTGETSNPGDTLSAWAATAHIDLVVLPTRSRDDLSRLVMGSVALRTAERAPCPVLVLPP